jgi:hypothetical protein
MLSIAIVGSGFGGLSLALRLGRQDGDDALKVVVLESQSSASGGIVGELHLPSGKKNLAQLGLSDLWEKLSSRSERIDHVSQACLQRALREKAASSIRYGHCVIGIEQVPDGRLLCLLDNDRPAMGPFDIVVGADGVLSRFRLLPPRKCGRVALVGDARWAQDRWWDFGTARIQGGADLAIRDGLELGELLLTRNDGWNLSVGDLGPFCAASKRREILRRRAIVLLLLAVVIYFNVWL